MDYKIIVNTNIYIKNIFLYAIKFNSTIVECNYELTASDSVIAASRPQPYDKLLVCYERLIPTLLLNS